jgi:N-acetylneuraminate synthase
MDVKFDFRGLFVLDLANNHQGDVGHATNLIRRHAEVVKKHGVRAAIKFQFRELDGFIHPAHRSGSNNKHIPRFLSTRLTTAQFETLRDEVRKTGLLAMCTPFDEDSVDTACAMGFDVLKVASCSAQDWPLLERIAAAGKPVVFSTGGLDQAGVDDLVSFFDHRGVDYGIMHCVPIYPTPTALCNLANIATFRERYPGRTIGWSTHEDPSDTDPVMVAVAKGAAMFERHIGLKTDKVDINAYSSTPEQIDAWLEAHRKAQALCGSSKRLPPIPEESDAIDGLKRGIFARGPIEKGTAITREQVYFAMPCGTGQLASGQWRDGMRALTDIPADGPLLEAQAALPPEPDVKVLKSAVHEVKALLNLARVPLSSEFAVEYSHHYGIGRFRETGVVIINCINREYCKKILVQIPGQAHPAHFHKRKEETFQVLWGELHTELDGRHKVLQPGDTQLVMPGVWHRFWTETGCVFEEVSTTHFNDDSVYRDPAINKLERSQRKTVVDHWGRFQILDAAGVATEMDAKRSDPA